MTDEVIDLRGLLYHNDWSKSLAGEVLNRCLLNQDKFCLSKEIISLQLLKHQVSQNEWMRKRLHRPNLSH